MQKCLKNLFILTLLGAIMIGFAKEEPLIQDYLDVNELKTRLAKYTPVEIGYDESALGEGDRQALLKMVQAAKLMDEIFLRQVYDKNVAIREELKTGANADYALLSDYFAINFGPFDRLKGDEPFINLNHPKPAGANYYPADMTKEAFEQWLSEHPEDREVFTGYFTIIRRQGDKLTAVPYSEAYKAYLEPAARLLKEAAALTENASLKTYLNSRADAFLSNDYFQSDMDWMDLQEHSIEIAIGPYEVYEDKLFGYKAAFEAFITIVNQEDGKKLLKVADYLDDLERRLPIPEQHKNYERGKASPIVVADEVFTAGDTKAGVQTIAFNLPNDERVREAKGSKKVMLKNVSRAKYENISTPIMQRVLAEADLAKVSFEAFFYHVLLHEMCHGIGPGKIMKNGLETTVNKELQEIYPTLEEAKADIVGLYQFPYMVEKGVFAKELAGQVYASFVGGIFRSVRFGVEAAHGGGNAIILNYLMEKGAVEFDPASERFRVNYQKIDAAVRDLSREILMIQALGDYQAGKAFIQKYRRVSQELQIVLNKLSDLPVDIRPQYAVEKKL